jgi:hypothetical protein
MLIYIFINMSKGKADWGRLGKRAEESYWELQRQKVTRGITETEGDKRNQVRRLKHYMLEMLLYDQIKMKRN